MKKLLAVVAAVAALAAIGVTAAISSGDGRAVLKFDTMAPVVPPYTGRDEPDPRRERRRGRVGARVRTGEASRRRTSRHRR